MEAFTQQLNITTYFPDLPYDTAIFNGALTVDATGTGLDDLAGLFKFDISSICYKFRYAASASVLCRHQ